mmetsp:Transcript_3148/g.4856  ORF Transcript_3148/g.4856 Transcript_3148/m.4856 type:complete len:257 (-) Transcript_3148:409-1179(-)
MPFLGTVGSSVKETLLLRPVPSFTLVAVLTPTIFPSTADTSVFETGKETSSISSCFSSECIPVCSFSTGLIIPCEAVFLFSIVSLMPSSWLTTTLSDDSVFGSASCDLSIGDDSSAFACVVSLVAFFPVSTTDSLLSPALLIVVAVDVSVFSTKGLSCRFCVSSSVVSTAVSKSTPGCSALSVCNLSFSTAVSASEELPVPLMEPSHSTGLSSTDHKSGKSLCLFSSSEKCFFKKKAWIKNQPDIKRGRTKKKTIM